MKKYTFTDGSSITSGGPYDLITQMQRVQEWVGSEADFMSEIATRAKRFSDCDVRTDDPANWLEDLISCGFVKVSDLPEAA